MHVGVLSLCMIVTAFAPFVGFSRAGGFGRFGVAFFLSASPAAISSSSR